MSKMREMMDQAYPWVDVWTPDGTKQYQITLVRQRRGRLLAMRVQKLVGKLIMIVTGKTAKERADALDAIPEEELDNLGKELLSGCNIRENPDFPEKMITLDRWDETSYFDDNILEYQSAILAAIRANYPKSLGRLEKVIRGFIPKIEAAMKQKLDILSMTEPSQPTQSQNGTE